MLQYTRRSYKCLHGVEVSTKDLPDFYSDDYRNFFHGASPLARPSHIYRFPASGNSETGTIYHY